MYYQYMSFGAQRKSRYNLKNALKNVKIDFLNIRNPKVFDAEGRDWRHITKPKSTTKEAYQEFLGILKNTDIADYQHDKMLVSYPITELQDQLRQFTIALEKAIRNNWTLEADSIPSLVWAI